MAAHGRDYFNRQGIGAGASSSSSSSSRPPNPTLPDPDDLADLLANNDADDAVWRDDPPDNKAPETLSFKRKQKQSAFTTATRFLSNLSTDYQPAPLGRGATSSGASGADAPTETGPKDPGPLDWYVEGPGRRVGYEDLTAIDWIFEYTKERQRLRVLYSSATGVIGYVQQLLDSSQVWIILVLTGIAVGAIAAGIDVVSDWLGDLKGGYCSASTDGGAFYLNRAFCCWGYDQGDKCIGWRPWAVALGVTSGAGKWLIEYFFFLCSSVGFMSGLASSNHVLTSIIGSVCGMCGLLSQGVRHVCQA